MGITSDIVSIMRSLLAFACLLVVTFGAASGNDRDLRRTIKEGQLYEKIKDILKLELILYDVGVRDDSVDLGSVPEKNEIRQVAINKYTTGLIPGSFVSNPIFKDFYPILVAWQGTTAIILPNTKKT